MSSLPDDTTTPAEDNGGGSSSWNPFAFVPPVWLNQRSLPEEGPSEALQRAKEAASAYYAMGVQTGVHSMIEWCGVMGEYVKMLEYAHTVLGVDPDEVDQHSGVTATALPYMVEYLCEKLGCQLKPFIHGDPETWRKAINKWFP